MPGALFLSSIRLRGLGGFSFHNPPVFPLPSYFQEFDFTFWPFSVRLRHHQPVWMRFPVERFLNSFPLVNVRLPFPVLPPPGYGSLLTIMLQENRIRMLSRKETGFFPPFLSYYTASMTCPSLTGAAAWTCTTACSSRASSPKVGAPLVCVGILTTYSM